MLVEHVTGRLHLLRWLLHDGHDLPAGQQLNVDGRSYTRLWTDYDEHHLATDGEPPVRLRDDATGDVINLGVTEPAAFWEWAIVETLRLSGIRIEELLEMTQLSIRRY